jgi:UDP-glucose 4-epimerase
MRKIIITGGAGYIGSHTVVELYKSGFTPIIIDNLCNSSERNIKGISEILGKDIKWHNVDCTNQKEIDNIFELEGNIEGIIHFAAYKSVEESVQNPKKYYENNIGSLEVILNSMEKYKVNNIIFSSSCTVYGIPNLLPVTENAPFKKAESPYGETKQLCEKILMENNFSSVSLRYFNPIGSHPSSLIGDCSADKASNLIPIITETAIGKRKNITVFGNDYNTSDGTCIRDYIHVVDLAKSHVKSMDFLIKNDGKHAFNIGTGIGVSVLQAISIFEKSNNIKVNYSVGPRRSGDIEQIYANCDLSQEKLNWKGKQTLKQAMIDAWNWEKKKK